MVHNWRVSWNGSRWGGRRLEREMASTLFHMSGTALEGGKEWAERTKYFGYTQPLPAERRTVFRPLGTVYQIECELKVANSELVGIEAAMKTAAERRSKFAATSPRIKDQDALMHSIIAGKQEKIQEIQEIEQRLELVKQAKEEGTFLVPQPTSPKYGFEKSPLYCSDYKGNLQLRLFDSDVMSPRVDLSHQSGLSNFELWRPNPAYSRPTRKIAQELRGFGRMPPPQQMRYFEDQQRKKGPIPTPTFLWRRRPEACSALQWERHKIAVADKHDELDQNNRQQPHRRASTRKGENKTASEKPTHTPWEQLGIALKDNNAPTYPGQTMTLQDYEMIEDAVTEPDQDPIYIPPLLLPQNGEPFPIAAQSARVSERISEPHGSSRHSSAMPPLTDRPGYTNREWSDGPRKSSMAALEAIDVRRPKQTGFKHMAGTGPSFVNRHSFDASCAQPTGSLAVLHQPFGHQSRAASFRFRKGSGLHTVSNPVGESPQDSATATL